MGRWFIGIVALVLCTGTGTAQAGTRCREGLLERDRVEATTSERACRPRSPSGPSTLVIHDRDARPERAEGVADVGGPGLLLWLLSPAISILLVAGGVALWLARRGRPAARTRGGPQPISLLIVERLARATERRSGVLATLGVVAVPVLVVMQLGPDAAALAPGAIFATIVACVGLRGFFVARAVLGLIEPAGNRATAELDGGIVIVRDDRGEALLEVSPRALASARRHGVPTSIAKRS